MNDEPFCLDAPALPARRRIAVERYCAGIRPDDVAREAGVTRATLARWLREPACRAYMTRITERAADDASRLIRAGTLEAVRTELDILRGANPSAALAACRDMKLVCRRLQVLDDLGLGYLTLGEATPSLSGGEAQRLKLAGEMDRAQQDSVFVFDEPTIGLHPLDVKTLVNVFQTLIGQGATVIVIEHDLDVIRSADYVIDMGPGGGEEGGTIVAAGTPEDIKNSPASKTGKFL